MPPEPRPRLRSSSRASGRRSPSGGCGSPRSPGRAGPAPSPQALLEPVVRVRLVIERLDLAVTGAAVEADGLLKGAVRLQADGASARSLRLALELSEHPPAHAQATH